MRNFQIGSVVRYKHLNMQDKPLALIIDVLNDESYKLLWLNDFNISNLRWFEDDLENFIIA